MLLSWDFYNFLLNDVFLLVDDVGLDNFDNLVNNSFDFFDFSVLVENLNDLFNDLWDLHNLFLDVRNGNWFFNDLLNFDWDFDGQSNWLFDLDEDLSLNNGWNDLLNDDFFGNLFLD